MSPEYYCILLARSPLGKRTFIRCGHRRGRTRRRPVDAFITCAVWMFLYGDIDDRTLWCVSTLPTWFPVEWSSDLFTSSTGSDENGAPPGNAAVRRFGRCRPFLIGSPFRPCATATPHCARKTREGLSALSGSRGDKTGRFISAITTRPFSQFQTCQKVASRHVRHC